MLKESEILGGFYAALNRDVESGLVLEWMNKWYWKELDPRFGASDGFKGAKDIFEWYLGQSTCRTYHNTIPSVLIDPIADLSVACDKKVFSNDLFSSMAHAIPMINFRNYGIYNAQDYLFSKQIASLSGVEPRVVMDFGAGSGRQANLWSQDRSARTLIAVDGIAQTYCMQALYYPMLGVMVNDYLESGSNFKVQQGGDEFLINHIPSWRMDLIEGGSVDLILTVQVLGELRPDMTEHVIDNFYRILRPGGILYVRDHGKLHNPNGTDIKSSIAKRGFRLEFEPALEDKVEVHGVPKVWRK